MASKKENNFLETIREIKRENEALKRELRKHRRKLSGIIGYVLLFLGATTLIASVTFTSSILAFTGLGLTFWGALLLFITPTKYIRGELLGSTVISSLSAVDKVISELDYNGKAIYLPPRHLKGLSEATVYIPFEDKVEIPTAEETEKVFLKNPNGLCLPSAGAGLMSFYEKELGVNFSKVSLEYLQLHLPQLLVEDLEIFEDFDMKSDGNVIHVKMKGSVYQDLCNQVSELKHVCQSYGCPLCASIACALTKSTGKPLQIENITHSNKNVIEVRYRFVDNHLLESDLQKLLRKLKRTEKEQKHLGMKNLKGFLAKLKRKSSTEKLKFSLIGHPP